MREKKNKDNYSLVVLNLNSESRASLLKLTSSQLRKTSSSHHFQLTYLRKKEFRGQFERTELLCPIQVWMHREDKDRKQEQQIHRVAKEEKN